MSNICRYQHRHRNIGTTLYNAEPLVKKQLMRTEIAEKCCKSTERFSSTFCNKRLNKNRTYCALELFIGVSVCRNKRKNNVFVLIAGLVFLSHESTFLVSMEYNKIASMMIPQEFT